MIRIDLKDCISASFFYGIIIRTISFLNTSVKESFLYKKMVKMDEWVPNIRFSYVGLVLLMIALSHSGFLLNPHLGSTFDLSIFFYTFIFISVLFLLTPSKLGEVFKNSLIIRMVVG